MILFTNSILIFVKGVYIVSFITHGQPDKTVQINFKNKPYFTQVKYNFFDIFNFGGQNQHAISQNFPNFDCQGFVSSPGHHLEPVSLDFIFHVFKCSKVRNVSGLTLMTKPGLAEIVI